MKSKFTRNDWNRLQPTDETLCDIWMSCNSMNEFERRLEIIIDRHRRTHLMTKLEFADKISECQKIIESDEALFNTLTKWRGEKRPEFYSLHRCAFEAHNAGVITDEQFQRFSEKHGAFKFIDSYGQKTHEQYLWQAVQYSGYEDALRRIRRFRANGVPLKKLKRIAKPPVAKTNYKALAQFVQNAQN